jgi:hypothetical protein
MTPPILESIFTWRSLINTTMPPRDPNDNDDEEEEEDDEDDEEDENREPAVIREPDEDESARGYARSLDRGDYFVAVAASCGRWRVEGRESRRADTRAHHDS